MNALTPSIASLVLDTSCLVAIIATELESEAFKACISQATNLHLSAVSRVELGMVVKQRNLDQQLLEVLAGLQVKIVAFDDSQAQLAIAAFTQFGKGRHKAGLNFGDCCAYALAKSLKLPLLFKGNDFAQTDITSALV